MGSVESNFRSISTVEAKTFMLYHAEVCASLKFEFATCSSYMF